MEEFGWEADRKEDLISRLLPGDFFYAIQDNSVELICIVNKINDGNIISRRITSQETIEIYKSGKVIIEESEDVNNFEIKSVEPLPFNIIELLQGVDRRYRLSSNRSRLMLSLEEKRALSFALNFYQENSF